MPTRITASIVWWANVAYWVAAFLLAGLLRLNRTSPLLPLRHLVW
jgi:hypothetical protein